MRVDPNNLEGSVLHDGKGQAVGRVEEVFVDEKTRQPEWVVVQIGTSERLVPLVDVSTLDDGIQVPLSREKIDSAPQIHYTDRLGEQDERALYDHYGLAYGTACSDTLLPEGECSTSSEPGWKAPLNAPAVEQTYKTDMAAFRQYALLRWSELKSGGSTGEEPRRIDAANFEAARIFDPQGNEVGRVEDVFVDERTHRPAWLLIAMGTRERLVPALDLKALENGVQVPFAKDKIVAAPQIAAEAVLTEGDERALNDYYGVVPAASGQEGPLSTPLQTPLEGARRGHPLAPFRQYVLRRWSGVHD
jgi:sporulation protein YlmC with PRC-barrel domain